MLHEYNVFFQIKAIFVHQKVSKIKFVVTIWVNSI